jgi:hypothetical protein
LPFVLDDMLLAPTLPLPLCTVTPLPLPTVLCADTLPFPACTDVDMPLGGFSPGFKCTTLQPFELDADELAANAEPAAKPAITSTASAAADLICFTPDKFKLLLQAQTPHGPEKR